MPQMEVKPPIPVFKSSRSLRRITEIISFYPSYGKIEYTLSNQSRKPTYKVMNGLFPLVLFCYCTFLAVYYQLNLYLHKYKFPVSLPVTVVITLFLLK
jgi:hypothetical protein